MYYKTYYRNSYLPLKYLLSIFEIQKDRKKCNCFSSVPLGNPIRVVETSSFPEYSLPLVRIQFCKRLGEKGT